MKKQFITFSSLLLSLSACLQDADRTNPLDPGGEQFQGYGALTVQAQSIHSPPRPLGDVLFELSPGGILRRTDSDGLLTFDRIEPGRYLITGTKSGYAAVSDSVSISVGQTNMIGLALDGLPQISDLQITTHHVSQWTGVEEIFFLEIRARATDPDGVNDVDFLRMGIPGLGIEKTANNPESSGFYLWRLEDIDLPGGSIQQALGHEIDVIAVDVAGLEGNPRRSGLSRIILQTPIANSPSGGQPVQSDSLKLSWEPMVFPFEFTYEIEVVRHLVRPDIFETVLEKDEISPGTNSTTVITSLVPGYYYWTVSVVDEFGNWSRSKQAAFLVP